VSAVHAREHAILSAKRTKDVDFKDYAGATSPGIFDVA
jgi:hypothetical protein